MIQDAKKIEAAARPSVFGVWCCSGSTPQQRASPTERLMLAVIVSQMRTSDERRFDSTERLAELMGCSVRTAQMTKKALAKKGYIVVTERVAKDGRRGSDYLALGDAYFKAAAKALKRPLTVVPEPESRGAESAPSGAQNLPSRGAESAGECREGNVESSNTKTLRFPEGKTPPLKRGTRQTVADALQVICLPGDWQRYGGMKHLGATARMALEFHELDVIKRWVERVRSDGFAGQVPLGKVLPNIDAFTGFERREAI